MIRSMIVNLMTPRQAHKRPQAIACIAPTKPPTMLQSVGNRFKIRINLRKRATRSIRRTLMRFSSGMLARAMPRTPMP